ncbi:outer membrane beta-barrel protein [Methylobacterium sp. J-068]|uniref:outer membrane beta-barrel protein n=1 Tax=Methylobacterium sp. J-068 TaxID=2836649 RepID=UPI001FB94B90|nr:outer membrane beta-barrel protein [Methylobacterium sp. J-068]MCJ2032910.1 porin [Methylobacterium sp. J-068]
MAMNRSLLALSAVLLSSVCAYAADLKAPVAPAPPPAACKAEITFPAYGGVIKQNPNPACLTIGGLGDIYVGGAVSGYFYTQTNPSSIVLPGIAADRAARVDFSNLMGFIQKADGPFQFYAAFGAYTIPGLGAPIFSAFDQTNLLFSPAPIVFGKYVINDNWSIQGGRMPTLIGSELPFTFQNLNISRGLLFAQENVINHGVQINYADGPWSASFAATDGFFSGEINWVTGAITYKIDAANTIGINGGTHFSSYTRFDFSDRSLRNQFTTPQTLQNSSIVSANYTYADGPWIVTPYIQYTNVERNDFLVLAGAETFGAAVLASYAFTDNFALAGRVEYITQSGTRGNFAGQSSVLYGPGSSAFSFTVTPTFTFDRYFLRGEFSTVQLYDTSTIIPGVLGTGFGRNGLKTSQERYMIETGITF